MARATFVKAARKDYPEHGIKKGESYYWWAFMQGGRGGPKRFSKTKPRRSQLTQSNFYAQLWDAEDALQALQSASYDNVADLEGDLESIKSDLDSLRDEMQENFDNMPEGLQQGDSGQLLETRVSELESLIGEFDNLDFSEPDEVSKKSKNREETEDARKEAVSKRIEEIIDEVSSFNWSID